MISTKHAYMIRSMLYIALLGFYGSACSQDLVIVALGDSTTNSRNVGADESGRPAGAVTSEGLNSTDEDNTPHNVVNTVNGNTGDLYVYSDRLRDELPGLGINPQWVDNEGIGGNRADQADSRLNNDVLAKNPDIVIVQFGINDARFNRGSSGPSKLALNEAEQYGPDGVLGGGDDHPNAAWGNYIDHMNNVVDALLAEGIKIVLMTPNKILDTHENFSSARTDLYAQAIRDIAAAKGTELIDIAQHFEDYGEINGGYDNLLLDALHPNGDGHALVADLLSEKIKEIALHEDGGNDSEEEGKSPPVESVGE